MLKKLFNYFKKSKPALQVPNDNLSIIKEFRKQFKKDINTMEGGNIPGVTIRHPNFWVEKSNKE